MNRSDRYRCVFFHIPKTAGSSIESLDWWDRWTGHFPAAAAATVPKGYYSFCFVRNPWDRFVSLYHYFATMTPDHRWYGANARLAGDVRRIGSFADFCRNFSTWRFRDNYHFRPQCRWITDAVGNLAVDFVGRFERLQDDVNAVCHRLGAPPVELPVLNRSSHGPYLNYYSDETREIVADLSREDIAAFGYLRE